MQTEETQKAEHVDIPPVTGPYTEPWSLKKIIALASVFGPAAIVASVSIGAGETIVVVRAGAWAEYNLLWLVLLSCVVKAVFVTYLLGRYTAVSGEYIGNRLANCRDREVGSSLRLSSLKWLGHLWHGCRLVNRVVRCSIFCSKIRYPLVSHNPSGRT